jgi:hypothetical protein
VTIQSLSVNLSEAHYKALKGNTNADPAIEFWSEGLLQTQLLPRIVPPKNTMNFVIQNGQEMVFWDKNRNPKEYRQVADLTFYVRPALTPKLIVWIKDHDDFLPAAPVGGNCDTSQFVPNAVALPIDWTLPNGTKMSLSFSSQ